MGGAAGAWMTFARRKAGVRGKRRQQLTIRRAYRNIYRGNCFTAR